MNSKRVHEKHTIACRFTLQMLFRRMECFINLVYKIAFYPRIYECCVCWLWVCNKWNLWALLILSCMWGKLRIDQNIFSVNVSSSLFFFVDSSVFGSSSSGRWNERGAGESWERGILSFSRSQTGISMQSYNQDFQWTHQIIPFSFYKIFRLSVDVIPRIVSQLAH